MASRASKIAVEDSIAEFNKTRHRNSGTTGSESENANGKPKPPKKKPKKAKSVYARSVMTTMTNKVSILESVLHGPKTHLGNNSDLNQVCFKKELKTY